MGRTGATIEASTENGTPGLRVGSVAVAMRECGVFRLGEAGVCFEAYRIGGRPGWSFIFERGGFDGFSPSDVGLCLHVTGEVAPGLEGYEHTGIGRLLRDWREGRFTVAFARARAWVGREGRA